MIMVQCSVGHYSSTIGLFVLTLGLLGVFGSITQSPRMMNVYVGLIVVVLILELVLLVGSHSSGG